MVFCETALAKHMTKKRSKNPSYLFSFKIFANEKPQLRILSSSKTDNEFIVVYKNNDSQLGFLIKGRNLGRSVCVIENQKTLFSWVSHLHVETKNEKNIVVFRK